jgi:hypothetical protein
MDYSEQAARDILEASKSRHPSNLFRARDGHGDAAKAMELAREARRQERGR